MIAHTASLALGAPQGVEWLVILIVGLLVFGKRLPEVARSFGKAILEFKKGMQDVQDDVARSAEPARAASGAPAGAVPASQPGVEVKQLPAAGAAPAAPAQAQAAPAENKPA
jgi:TatA/E family protein of Tat protein translocase